MKIAYSPRAIRDLRNISAYLKPRSLLGPNNVRVAILTSIYQLSIFPEAGAPQNTQGVRKIITRKYRYLIYYTIDHGADEILVITINMPRNSVSSPTNDAPMPICKAEVSINHRRIWEGMGERVLRP